MNNYDVYSVIPKYNNRLPISRDTHDFLAFDSDHLRFVTLSASRVDTGGDAQRIHRKRLDGRNWLRIDELSVVDPLRSGPTHQHHAGRLQLGHRPPRRRLSRASDGAGADRKRRTDMRNERARIARLSDANEHRRDTNYRRHQASALFSTEIRRYV